MGKQLRTMLASAATLLSVTLAWGGIVLLLQRNPYAFVLIVFAFASDCCDGTIARALGVVSLRGRELDSMADVLIYIVWPALAYYFYFYLQDPVSIVLQLIFVCAGVYRLARFNEMGYITWKGITGYPGLPVVFSHFVVLVLLICPVSYRTVTAAILILVHSILMVMQFPFPRPKNWIVACCLCVGLYVAWRYV